MSTKEYFLSFDYSLLFLNIPFCIFYKCIILLVAVSLKCVYLSEIILKHGKNYNRERSRNHDFLHIGRMPALATNLRGKDWQRPR